MANDLKPTTSTKLVNKCDAKGIRNSKCKKPKWDIAELTEFPKKSKTSPKDLKNKFGVTYGNNKVNNETTKYKTTSQSLIISHTKDCAKKKHQNLKTYFNRNDSKKIGNTSKRKDDINTAISDKAIVHLFEANHKNKLKKTKKDEHNKKIKPATSLGSNEDASLRGLLDLYSDEVGVEIDKAAEAVQWPLLSLEDTHLDIPENKDGICNKSFSTGFEMAKHTCSKKPFKSPTDFSAFNKTLKKRGLFSPDPGQTDFKDKGKIANDNATIGSDKKQYTRGVDIGPFTCPICKKEISRRSGLKIHIRRHTGDMPYQCEYCKKKFAALYDLDRHTLTHVGDEKKKFRLMCEVCRKPFVSKDGLSQHLKIAHPKFTNFTCKLCEMTFNEDYKLLKHMAEHENEKQTSVIEESLELLESFETTQSSADASANNDAADENNALEDVDINEFNIGLNGEVNLDEIDILDLNETADAAEKLMTDDEENIVTSETNNEFTNADHFENEPSKTVDVNQFNTSNDVPNNSQETISMNSFQILNFNNFNDTQNIVTEKADTLKSVSSSELYNLVDLVESTVDTNITNNNIPNSSTIITDPFGKSSTNEPVNMLQTLNSNKTMIQKPGPFVLNQMRTVAIMPPQNDQTKMTINAPYLLENGGGNCISTIISPPIHEALNENPSNPLNGLQILNINQQPYILSNGLDLVGGSNELRNVILLFRS